MDVQIPLVFDKTQIDFDNYIIHLPDKIPCKYMEDFHNIMNVCNCVFPCKYQDKAGFRFNSNSKDECKRPRMLKLKKIL